MGVTRSMKFLGFHTFLGFAALAVSISAAQKTTKDQIYSKAQATRGEATYTKLCQNCHDPEKVPAGKKAAPPLKGDKFFAEWETRSLADFLEIIMTTMPNDGSAELTKEQTADVVAYIIHANGQPAGSADLKYDAGKDIVIAK